MSSGVGIAVFVAALLVMVVVHETGHFLSARAFGIKVEQFFVGFGPKIFSWHRGGTEYGLKAILLGGYVRIAGMNPWETIHESDRPRTFGAKPAWQRAIVLVAGSATHFVMGVVIMTVVFAFIGLPGFSMRLGVVDPDSPAHAAGFRPGDRVLEVEGRQVGLWWEFREIVQASAEKPLSIVVDRGREKLTLTATPATAKDPETGKDVGRLGLQSVAKEPLPSALVAGVKYTGVQSVESVKAMGKIFSPEGLGAVVESLRGEGERGPESPMGLIGGGREAGRIAARGEFGVLLVLVAHFIIFVGLINLAPLPPLDGGHLLVLLLEKIRGRPIDARKVVPVAAVVLTFFLLLTVALVYLDIVRPIQSPF